MKQVIPFNKEIPFKTMIKEIQSISLEHTLKVKEDNNIKGDFIISGSYKMTEASTIAEEFSYKIPVDIYIDEEYDLEEASVDIDDFKYNIVNDDTLSVKIDVLLDHIKLLEITENLSTDEEVIKAHLDKDYLKKKSDVISEKKMEKELATSLDRETKEEKKEKQEEKEEAIEIPIETKETKEQTEAVAVDSLFNKFSDEEDSYATYKVYIVRENDTLESIVEKYNVSLDELREYNNLDDLKQNDKLIIPSHNESV